VFILELLIIQFLIVFIHQSMNHKIQRGKGDVFEETETVVAVVSITIEFSACRKFPLGTLLDIKKWRLPLGASS